MLDLKFTSEARGAEAVVARYACPCGCTPSVVYERGLDVVADACCCGNHFAVGPDASSSLTPTGGFRLESQPLQAPWGEVLQAAWLLGPGVHTPAAEHDHAAEIEAR
jgi:hypothetical protein